MSGPVHVIMQARLGSTRLPGKVVKPLLGQPMILWQLDRLSNGMNTPHTITVAIPHEDDSDLGTFLRRHGYNVCAPKVDCNDVLLRYVETVKVIGNGDNPAIVRVTGDCPLIDPCVVDQVVQQHWLRSDAYTGSAPQWADGLDCEVVRVNALRTACFETRNRLDSLDREHVTSYIWRRPNQFPQSTLPCPLDLSEYCWSVDEPEDLDAVEELLQTCLSRFGWRFGWRETYGVIQESLNLRKWATGRKRNRSFIDQVSREMLEAAPPCAGWEEIVQCCREVARKGG